MVPRFSLAALLIAVALSGCGGSAAAGTRSSPRVIVPKVTGTTLRQATCKLTAKRLRWTQGRGLKSSVRPVSSCRPGGVRSSNDDLRVSEQIPAAGTPVKTNSIVILHDGCSASHPCS